MVRIMTTTSRRILAPLLLACLGACSSSADDNSGASGALAEDVAGNDMAVRVTTRASFDWVDDEMCRLASVYAEARAYAIIDAQLPASQPAQAGAAIEEESGPESEGKQGSRCVVERTKTLYLTESAFSPPPPVDETTVVDASLRAAGRVMALRKPELTGVQLRVEFSQPLKAPRVYPEYDKILRDNTLAAAILVRDQGPAGSGPSPTDRATRLVHFETLSSKLRAQGFAQASVTFPDSPEFGDRFKDIARTFSRSITTANGTFDARVSLFSEDWQLMRFGHWGTLQKPWAEAIFSADLVRGHNHGAEVSIRTRQMGISFGSLSEIFRGSSSLPRWPDHLIWVDYQLDLPGYIHNPLHAEGTGPDDIIRNVVFVPDSQLHRFGSQLMDAEDSTSAEAMAVFERLATELAKPKINRASWNAILRARNETAGQHRLVGTAMADNRWTPR